MARRAACGGCGTCAKCKRNAYMRDWYRRADNAVRQCESQRASRERRLEEIREYDRKRGYRVYDQSKVVVRRAVHLALQKGTLTRQPCEVCGAEKVDAHHDDYTKPLEVRWLCRRHHGEAHRRYLPSTVEQQEQAA